MSLLSWNCRGLGRPRIVQELVRFVSSFSSKIVFISETRQPKARVENIRFRLGLKNYFVVHDRGKGGGLGLFWDESIKIDILSYGLHHIDTLIWDGDHPAGW